MCQTSHTLSTKQQAVNRKQIIAMWNDLRILIYGAPLSQQQHLHTSRTLQPAKTVSWRQLSRPRTMSVTIISRMIFELSLRRIHKETHGQSFRQGENKPQSIDQRQPPAELKWNEMMMTTTLSKLIRFAFAQNILFRPASARCLQTPPHPTKRTNKPKEPRNNNHQESNTKDKEDPSPWIPEE